MILIYLPKRYLARALNSSTMAGEAVCSLSCIQITLVLFVGSLVFRLWQGGWWVDSATSIVLGLLFAREAYKMLSWVRNPDFNGGCCDACAVNSSLKDPKLELEERYRDLCECCFEKDECRDSETCKCESSSAEEVRLLFFLFRGFTMFHPFIFFRLSTNSHSNETFYILL